MWDEQERFAKGASKVFTWLLGALGVVLIITSLASGDPKPLFAFVQVLGVVAFFVLAYGLAAACVGGALLGISCGASYCIRWVRNHFFTHPGNL